MNRAEWLAWRREGIGGSDAAAVLGISPWRTPYDLYAEKIGDGDGAPETEPMRWGRLLEPVIAQRYAEITEREVWAAGALRHATHPFILGTPDGIADGRRLVEIKTTRVGTGWGEPGSDEIPLHYLAQVQHYLLLTTLDVADVVVLIGGSDLRIYTVEADAAIQAELVEREAEFWARVLRRDPPDPIKLADAVSQWGRMARPGQVIADGEATAAVATLRDLRAQRATLDAAEETAKLHIATTLRDAGDTLCDAQGRILATWRLDRGRAAYTVASAAPRRRLLIKE